MSVVREPGQVDGEIEFSDAELSEMNADVAGREPGPRKRRTRSMLRVPADEVPRQEELAVRPGLPTEPSLLALGDSEAADEVVEHAFKNGGVADGVVPAMLDLVDAMEPEDRDVRGISDGVDLVEDPDTDPRALAKADSSPTPIDGIDATVRGESGPLSLELPSERTVVSAPPAMVSPPPSPPAGVPSGMAALVRAVAVSPAPTGVVPPPTPATTPRALEALDEPVWSSSPSPTPNSDRPVVVGETGGTPSELPASAKALASAMSLGRNTRRIDDTPMELDGADVEEVDSTPPVGVDPRIAASRAPIPAGFESRSKTPLPPIPPGERERARTLTPLPPIPPPERAKLAAIVESDRARATTLPAMPVAKAEAAKAAEVSASPAVAPASPAAAIAPPADGASPAAPAPAGEPAPAAPASAAQAPTAQAPAAQPPASAPAAQAPTAPPPAPPPTPAPRERSVTSPGGTATAPAPAPAAAPAADSPLRPRKKRRSKQWYEEIFDEDYLRTLPYLTARQTEREAAFIAESLGVAPGGALLDVACGYGRHAMELAGKSYKVTGLDLSLPLLIRAADTARRASLNINFIHGDMREMTFENEFDGAYSMFTSFGYFDDDTNRKVAANLARAIKPGGRLLLDVVNRDYLTRDLPTRVWWQGEGCVVLEEVDFNYFSSRLQVQRSIIFEDGRQSEQEISIRAYSLHEIGKVLHHSGFRVTEVSGGLSMRGKFFGAQSRQLIVLAEKKAQP